MLLIIMNPGQTYEYRKNVLIFFITFYICSIWALLYTLFNVNLKLTVSLMTCFSLLKVSNCCNWACTTYTLTFSDFGSRTTGLTAASVWAPFGINWNIISILVSSENPWNLWNSRLLMKRLTYWAVSQYI